MITQPIVPDGAHKAFSAQADAPQAECLGASAIDEALLLSWQSLEQRLREPNIFCESRFLPAALSHCDPEGRARLFVLWAGAARCSPLLGLMPLSLERLYGSRRLPNWQNWQHPNAFLGNPLIAPGHERAFWRALLGMLDRSAGMGLFFHIDNLALDGAGAEALQALCREEGRRCDLVRRHERAFLRSDLGGEAYFEQAVRGKKRKELRRQKRRLEDMGTLRFLRSDGRQDLDGWIDAFLTLEASGWKGQEQSALGSQDRTRALFCDMLGAMAQAGKLELLSLEFEGAPIAMLVNLQSGDGIFSFKTTFDESFARFSPGVLLQIENYAMLDRPDIHWADSCAAPDHPMIDSLWTERRAIGRLSIAIGGPLRRKAFDALRWMEDHMAKRQGSKG